MARRGFLAFVGATVGALLSTQVAMATVESIAGAVPDDGSTAYYSVERCATYTGSFSLTVTSYPGTNLYVGYVLSSTGGESGFWTFSNGSGTPQSIGNLVSGTCFKLKAHKDWTWPWGTSNWGGNLDY